MTELGLSPGLTDSGVLITSLIALFETQPLPLMQNATEVTLPPPTRCLLIHPSCKASHHQKASCLSLSVALSPATSWTLPVQARPDTQVEAILPPTSHVVKGWELVLLAYNN